MNRRMLWIVLLIVILVPLLLAAWRIDDWSRDLTTNQASTSEVASAPQLRPIEYQGQREALAEIVRQAAEQLPRWQLIESQSTAETTEMHLTRQTAGLGFTDDIRVTLQQQGDTVRLTAHSQSRLGKADLGQNPRNLKELVGEVRRLIAR